MTINSFQGPYRFLSNFAPCLIEFEGIDYPSVEHAYQAAKSNNQSYRQIVARAATPGKAKFLGKCCPDLRKNWDTVKVEVMKRLVRQKFYMNDTYKQALLETAEKQLIEGNTWGDNFWGVCNGIGQNNLGKILMSVREELKL